MALLAYRSTPHSATKFSPAQLLMGRQLRTTLPVNPVKLKPQWPKDKTVRANDAQAKAAYAKDYNKRHGVKVLPDLEVGQRVRIKSPQEKQWSSPGTVIRTANFPRSYIVDTGQAQYRRNRKHIQAIPQEPQATLTDERLEPQQLTIPTSPNTPSTPNTPTPEPEDPGPNHNTSPVPLQRSSTIPKVPIRLDL